MDADDIKILKKFSDELQSLESAILHFKEKTPKELEAFLLSFSIEHPTLLLCMWQFTQSTHSMYQNLSEGFDLNYCIEIAKEKIKSRKKN